MCTGMWPLGSVSCPVCSYLFPLTTNRNSSSSSTCPHCATVCLPNPIRDEASVTFALPATLEVQGASLGALQEDEKQVRDNRVIEEAFCERCNAFRRCYSFAQQTRSADEGQTIFYTCTVCRTEWSSNS